MIINPSPAFKVYSNFRTKRQNQFNAQQVQEKTLLKLLNHAKDTQFGQEYQFDQINNVSDFQKSVPLRKYEDFWSQYWQAHYPNIENITWPGKYTMYGVSSGTSSGVTKYLPQTHELLKSNTKAGVDLLSWHFQNYQSANLFGGKCFFLGGTTEFKQETEDVISGDLSGIVAKNLAFYIKPFFFPPAELAMLSDWEEKVERFAQSALVNDIRLISGVPSWMLILFNRLFELKPEAGGLLQNVFPKLEVIVHGGVNFTPYLKTYQKLIAGSKIQLREVYPASEGFIAIGDRSYGEGLRLNLDHQIFYEFVPLNELDSPNPTRHWIGNVQKDINYAVVMTTCAGLWSYVVGDTVKFVDLDPYRILITGRTSYYLSAFGEHLIEEEVQYGIECAANDINKNISDFSVGAIFPKNSDELGGHLYIIEFETEDISAPELKRFTQILDRALCEKNEDYEAHRADGFGLRIPEVWAVKKGTFNQWMKSRGKLGGQNKVPRIISKTELFDNLKDHANQYLLL